MVKVKLFFRIVLRTIIVILLLFFIYIGLIVYPNVLFSNTVKYKHFKIFSRHEIDNNIYKILDIVDKNLSSSDFNDSTLIHNIYLCDSYKLYSFLVPMANTSFAFNYYHTNNIFIANCNIKKNEAYKINNNESFTKKLNVIIGHESTHTLTEKKLGFSKISSLDVWRIEGYCEVIGYNDSINFQKAKEYLATSKQNNKKDIYYEYYIAVNYLMQIEKMTFDDICKTKLSLDEILNKIKIL